MQLGALVFFASTLVLDKQHPRAVSVDLANAWVDVELERGDKMITYKPRELRTAGATFEIGGLALSLSRAFPELNPGSDNGSRAESYALSKAWERFSVDLAANRYTGVLAVAVGDGFDIDFKNDMHMASASVTASALLWTNGFVLEDVYGLKPSRGKGSGLFTAVAVDYLSMADPVGLGGESFNVTSIDDTGVISVEARAVTGLIGSGYSAKFWGDTVFVSTVAGYGLGRQQVTDTSPSGSHAASSRFSHKRYARQAMGFCGKQAFAGLLLTSDEPNFDMNGTALRSSRQSMMLSAGTTF